MMTWLLSLMVNAISFFAVSRILPGFKIKSFQTALGCSLVMSIIGTIAGILLIPMAIVMFGIAAILTGPLSVVFMFFMLFLLQTGLIMLTDYLIDDFEIDSTATAFIGSFLMTLCSMIISKIFLH